jgi:hypothetical protein
MLTGVLTTRPWQLPADPTKNNQLIRFFNVLTKTKNNQLIRFFNVLTKTKNNQLIRFF